MQPTGTAIPGNESFPVDNRVGVGASRLTKAGFGFVLKDGTFANPFFANFKAPAEYLEFYSSMTVLGGHTEVPVSFKAEQAPRP